MLPDHFDLRHLQVFLTLCDAPSMNEAAQRVGITQAGVSQLVVRLERAVGTRLFDRSQRPLRLTPAGQILEREARQILGQLHETHQRLRLADGASLPQLRLAMIDSYAGAAMPAMIGLIKRHIPTRQIRLLCGLAGPIGVALVEGAVDAVITTDVVEAATELPSVPILSEGFCIAAPPGEGGRGPLSQWARRPDYLAYPRSNVIGRQIRTRTMRLQIDLMEVLETDDTATLLGAVAAGHGWTITTPLCLLASGVPAERLSVHPIVETMGRRQIIMLTRQFERGALQGRLSEVARAAISHAMVHRLPCYGAFLSSLVDVGRTSISVGEDCHQTGL